MKKLSVIVPAYNEEETLPGLLNNWVIFCEDRDWNLIIVNDGSKDKTKEYLTKFPPSAHLQIIHHKVNRGYGAAIKSGIQASNSEYVVTIDADGQHDLQSSVELLEYIENEDADLVIGSRENEGRKINFRSVGKSIIRALSRAMVPNRIKDLNSGMKIYRTDLAKRYIRYCPNTMAFSDIITLTFLSEMCLVKEIPITIKQRQGGKSTINIQSAVDTMIEIINIVMLFNPLRLFLPITIVSFIAGLAWGIPFIVQGKGLSVGSLFAFIVSIFSLLLGLVAEQLSQIRKTPFRE